MPGMREPGRNVGGQYSKYGGYDERMGITKFQDFLFAINDDPDRRLTDEELSAAMHEEHPWGKRIPHEYSAPGSVRTIRRNYNIGTQNHGPAKRQSWPYWLENGERVRRPYPDGYLT
jgi:hypothetical protein